MTDSPRLERGYRRILALYPREFWRESEQEIHAVLMATARVLLPLVAKHRSYGGGSLSPRAVTAHRRRG